MKKIIIPVALLLGSISTKAQLTEHIDISTVSIFSRSKMVVYNSDTNYNDLECKYLGRNNDNWHWVKYSNEFKLPNIVVSLQDKPGHQREICIQDGKEKLECAVVDAFATEYIFKPKNKVFEIYISKTIKK